MRTVKVGEIKIGKDYPLVLIAGPCVIESRQHCLETASQLAALAESAQIPLIFKASYDKANRSSHQSFRGPGLTKGLEILREVKERYGLAVLTDVHNEYEVPLAAKVVDILQCPAFLSRQTDLILALGNSGMPVNIKKAQFMAPWDMAAIIAKLESTGNKNLLLTERGVSFGYNNLVADMRSLLIMREYGYPVIFDATHSVQLPGKAGTHSGGDARWAEPLARAAVAVGCDAVFIETHPNPAEALSDSATVMPLKELKSCWHNLSNIDTIVRKRKL